jgi:DNA repair exonuclease SbcCD ATPase subunit
MTNTIEKLTVKSVTNDIENLRAELKDAEQKLVANTENIENAYRVVGLRAQMKALEERLQLAKEAEANNTEYLKTPQAKKDLKRIPEIENEVGGILQEIIAAYLKISKLHDQLDGLQKEATKLNRIYGGREWWGKEEVGLVRRAGTEARRFKKKLHSWERDLQIRGMKPHFPIFKS